MVSHAPVIQKAAPREASDPTIWGLTPLQVHDRFWAARGVQVIRRGEPAELAPDAELFLLLDADAMVVFRLADLSGVLNWVAPDLLLVRVHDRREMPYRERVDTDQDRFVRLRREYGRHQDRLCRVALTASRRLAGAWCAGPPGAVGRRRLRRMSRDARPVVVSARGRVYHRTEAADRAALVHDLAGLWRRPDATIDRVRRTSGDAWVDPHARLGDRVRLVGPVWVGAGRRVEGPVSLVGPAVLWDEPSRRPNTNRLQWDRIEPSSPLARPIRPRRRSSFNRWSKRAFDVVFALFAIAVTLPLYPLVMLAILIEDGRPFFFGHRRETLGGREFFCFKFRSMRKDADRIQAKLAALNQADGPQFFIHEDRDPRLTRVGRIIRRLQIDELPQFFNVLAGDMAIIGPRPSPRRENQFCPAWREARLSLRPGITGLWQVRRSRRTGLDFQEWIRFDLYYVEHVSWRLDMSILARTIIIVIRGVLRW